MRENKLSRRKGKTATPKVRRSDAELQEGLARSLRTLEAACQRFDTGSRDDAFIIALVLRSLLHYGSSPPILHQTGVIKKLLFVDSGPGDLDPGVVVIAGGLTVARVSSDSEGNPSGQLLPKLREGSGRRRRFTDWWKNDLVVLGQDNRWFTRHFLVTEMANTEVAHFDPWVDEGYASLDDSGGGWSTDDGPLGGDTATASVRQIAWEVLKTLDDYEAETRAAGSSPKSH